MTLEPSTINLFLGALIGLQVWQVKQIYELRQRLGIMERILATLCGDRDSRVPVRVLGDETAERGTR